MSPTAAPSRRAPSRRAPSRLARSRLARSRLAPSRRAPSRWLRRAVPVALAGLLTAAVAAPPAGAATAALLVGPDGTHTGGTGASGASVASAVYAWVADDGQTRSVAFSVDGRAVRTEGVAPFDLGGTDEADRGRPTTLTPGTHALSAVVTSTSGSTRTLTGTVRVVVPETALPPPYSGPTLAAPGVGAKMIRSGPLQRVTGWRYTGDPLVEFRPRRGFVDPVANPGVLSNQYRPDGTALNANYGIPTDFTGYVPVFTAGNTWPVIHPGQRQPPYPDLQGAAGVAFRDGAVVPSTVTQPGSTGAVVVNDSPYSVLLTAGSYPGNEQPGQAMTPVNPGATVALPIPPRGWYPDGSGNPRVPELYSSVAGLVSRDAVGWHTSNTSPDYGTPGFAYVFSGKYSQLGSFGEFLFAGFGKNEGYDPALSGDPGYGVLLYLTPKGGGPRELVAVTDLTPTGSRSARQDLWAAARFNPGLNAQGGLSAFPNGPTGTTFTYEFVSHARAQQVLAGQSGVLHQTYAD